MISSSAGWLVRSFSFESNWRTAVPAVRARPKLVAGDVLTDSGDLGDGDAGAEGRRGAGGDAVLAPSGGGGREGEEAGGVGTIDEEAEGGAGDPGGGGAGGERREIELEKRGEAIADSEIGQGAEVGGRLGSGEMGVCDEGGRGGMD